MEACQTTLNDQTREQLGRVQKSCCFCIPRRFGITVLAIIKLMLSLCLLLNLIEILTSSSLFGYLLLFYNIILWMAITLDLVDIIIALVVIISVCMKNRRIMKMYYMYSICVFGAITFMCCLIVFIDTLSAVTLMIILSVFFFVFVMQGYLNHLLKIEVLKLESCEQFQL